MSCRTFGLLGLALSTVVSAAARGAEPTASEITIAHICDLVSWLAPPTGEKDLCLVSPGGTLAASDEGRRTSGAFSAEALTHLGYKAVNLASSDLSLGADAVKAALAAGPFVSANVRDASTGARLARSHVVLKMKDLRVGITGVTAPPGPGEALPADLSAKVNVQDAGESLKDVEATLQKDADLRILLVHGDALVAADLLRKHPLFQVGIVSGWGPGDPSPLAVGTSLLFRSPAGGESFALARLARKGRAGFACSDPRLVGRCCEPPEGLAALREKHGLPADSAVAIVRAAVAPPGAPGTAADGEAPPPFRREGIVGLNRSAANRAVSLSVASYRVAERYGDLAPAPGRSFVVLDTRWENIIPLTLVYDRQLPTEYRIPDLADHLYLVASGARLCRLLPATDRRAGHVPLKDFRLERIGSRIEGNILFELDPRDVSSLELRYYDFAHGPMRLSLAASGETAPPTAVPEALARNEVVEAAVHGWSAVEELEGRKAPPGMGFLRVDLRARSLFTLEADATAFDPKAKKGSKVRVGTVADWQEARKYAQLVVDGEYGYSPLSESTLPEEPRFLPDLATGGDLVFLVPEAASSLELRCDFPNARIPGSGKVIRPAGLTLVLRGPRPELPRREPIASVVDDFFEVAVTGQSCADELAGEGAGEGLRFLVLDVTVRNTGKGGEFFQPLAQLQHAAEDGTQVGPDGATQKGIHPPGEVLWIPAGERRSFQVAYRIPAEETKPRLAYAGVSLATVLDLKAVPRAAGTVAGGEEAPPEAAPGADAPDEMAADAAAAEAAAAAAAAAAAGASAASEESSPGEAAPAEPAEETVEAPAEGEPPATGVADARKVPPGPPPEPRGLEGVGLTAEEVNAAIDRGAAFLWAYIQEEDLRKRRRAFGADDEHILAALALVHSDAHKKFPALDRALRRYLAGVDPGDLGTYAAGILAMTIETFGDAALLPAARRCASYLLEAQGPQGSWSYTASMPAGFLADLDRGRALQVSGGVPLDGSPRGGRMERRLDGKVGADGDNSVSQYAILGLHAVSRFGLSLPPDVWSRSLRAYSGRQNEDGGWGYTTGGSYGSMTCAGICSVALCRAELGEKDPGEHPAIRKGLEWLASHFSVTEHPELREWYFYYLYSLERVGRILGTEFVGDSEWYPLGARQLLSTQNPDGGWIGNDDEEDPRLATSFALLFLTRATPTLRTTVARNGNGTLRTGIVLSPEERLYMILDASGSMIDEMGGRQKFDIARDAVAAIVGDLPEGSQAALRVYGHRKRATESGASEDTELLIRMGPLARSDFLAKLKSLRARGKTPLALSLREAKKDLSHEGEPLTVVLLTDGGEDTFPMQDPLKAADEFAKLSGVTLHVVGFDIGREDKIQQLHEISRRAGGHFWPAREASSLVAELRHAVFGTPDGFTVFDTSGKDVARGAFGESRTLPEGKYRLRADLGTRAFETDFWINTDAVTGVVFDAGQAPRAEEETPVAPAAPAATAEKASPGTPPATGEAAPAAPPADAEKAAPRFCTGCGKSLKPDQKFCSSCGKKVGN